MCLLGMQLWHRAKDKAPCFCTLCHFLFFEVTNYAHALPLCDLSLYRWLTAAVRTSLSTTAAGSSTTKPAHSTFGNMAASSRHTRVSGKHDGKNRTGRDE